MNNCEDLLSAPCKIPKELITHDCAPTVPGETQEEKEDYIKTLAIEQFQPFAESPKEEIDIHFFQHNASGIVARLTHNENKVIYRRAQDIPHEHRNYFPIVGYSVDTFDQLSKLKTPIKPAVLHISESRLDVLFEWVEGILLATQPKIFNDIEVRKKCIRCLAEFSNNLKGKTHHRDNTSLKDFKNGVIEFANLNFEKRKDQLKSENLPVFHACLEIIQDQRYLQILKSLNRENNAFLINHNDGHMFNFLYKTETKTPILLDFECAGDNPLGYDFVTFIVGLTCLFNYETMCFDFDEKLWPSQEQQDILLKEYLDTLDTSDFDVELSSYEKVKKDLGNIFLVYSTVFFIYWATLLSIGKESLNMVNQFESSKRLKQFIEKTYF